MRKAEPETRVFWGVQLQTIEACLGKADQLVAINLINRGPELLIWGKSGAGFVETLFEKREWV